MARCKISSSSSCRRRRSSPATEAKGGGSIRTPQWLPARAHGRGRGRRRRQRRWARWRGERRSMAARTGEARRRPRRPPLQNEGEGEGEGEAGEGEKISAGARAPMLASLSSPRRLYRRCRRGGFGGDRGHGRRNREGEGATQRGRWAGLLGRAEAQGAGGFLSLTSSLSFIFFKLLFQIV